MKAVDATFPIDIIKGVPAAAARAQKLEDDEEPIAIPASALAEVLVGAYHSGGWLLAQTLALVEPFEVMPADATLAHEAGRLGAEMARRGAKMTASDLLVAAACTLRGLVLITRNGAFSGVPGLAVETY